MMFYFCKPVFLFRNLGMSPQEATVLQVEGSVINE